MTLRQFFQRWLKFNAVGAIGIVVQLAALALFWGLLRINYLAATALAVETAVLHNFVWHEQWTWVDRTGSRRGACFRLARFNLTTGLVSLVTNLVLMRLLVGRFQIHPLIANMLSIAAGSLANFFLSDWFVFPRRAAERRKA